MRVMQIRIPIISWVPCLMIPCTPFTVYPRLLLTYLTIVRLPEMLQIDDIPTLHREGSISILSSLAANANTIRRFFLGVGSVALVTFTQRPENFEKIYGECAILACLDSGGPKIQHRET